MLVLFNAALAYALDKKTLLLMYLPHPDSEEERTDTDGSLFCFGAHRRSGFRFTNYVMSEAFLWAILHLFGGTWGNRRALPSVW